MGDDCGQRRNVVADSHVVVLARRMAPFGIVLIVIIFTVFVVGLAGCTTQPGPGSFRVVKVVDGDTAYLRGSGDQFKVRLVCIDAPEAGQAYGNAPRKHLSRQIGGQSVSWSVAARIVTVA